MHIISFSPTGNTARFLRAIAEGMGHAQATWFDLSSPDHPPNLALSASDIALIGAPVYRGRVPILAAQRLQTVSADRTPAVLVVSYGNRAYEDALLELSDIARARGFLTVAAGAFVGEHSYSTPALPLAQDRPDGQDLDSALEFGHAVLDKLKLGLDPVLPDGIIPGHRPYRDHGPLASRPPVTDPDLCTLCGECAHVCPAAAITVDTAVVTSIQDCIMCCACTRCCPENARNLNDPHVEKVRQWLADNFSARRDAETFL